MSKYCKFCIFLRNEEGSQNIIYRETILYNKKRMYKRVRHLDDYCICNIKKSVRWFNSPIKKRKAEIEIVDDPKVLNKNNNCIFYKENIILKVLRKIEELYVKLTR